MIVFDLRCRREGHVFEAWFGSSDEYLAQQERGLVQCPLCGDGDVDKFVTAPRMSPKSGGDAEDPRRIKAMLAAMAGAQKAMLEQSDYVGEKFATEARAIHLGEADARSIHGKATKAETASLIEDGIKVSPLPFPVVEPGQEN